MINFQFESTGLQSRAIWLVNALRQYHILCKLYNPVWYWTEIFEQGPGFLSYTSWIVTKAESFKKVLSQVQWLGVEHPLGFPSLAVLMHLMLGGARKCLCLGRLKWHGKTSFTKFLCVTVFKYGFSVCNFLYWFVIRNSFHVCCTTNSSIPQWLIW